MDELRELIAAARHIWCLWAEADFEPQDADFDRLENAFKPFDEIEV